ncbi:MAG TPA: hypothetical protein VH619_15185 [Verrucomicrobiae bacterium]|jgi:hypothetical protein|nr:hypothetical protein [Verrucomicrobiae bacterium]
MRIPSIKPRLDQGSTLLTVVIIGAIMCLSASSMLIMSSTSIKNAYGRVDWDKSFYDCENAVVWAAQSTFDTTPGPSTSNYYSTARGTLPIREIIASNDGESTFNGAWVQVVQPANLPTNVFIVTASACVNQKVRTLQSQITIRPISLVFDYEYFLNNWGWWWGNTITGNGSQRANWDFDFRDGPTVNGSIYAADQVEDDEIPVQTYATPPFAGLAGADETNLVHQGAPRVMMPNLLNFSNYTATAMANTASNGLWIGTNQIVAGVLPDSATPNPGGNDGNVTPQTGLYVVGTPGAPLIIKGTVVIPGDLVIQGTITGQGTFYVGGNLYVAGNITYAHGPDFSASPETEAPNVRDAWVSQNTTNDLVAYAVRGSILAGDVTDPDWVNYCYNYPGSGLQYVGDESHLGQDGIASTPDDNIPFLHSDGAMSTWYDADGDGLVEGNYNYNTDITMTAARASQIVGYPSVAGVPVAYSQVATDNMGTLQGIFYTDHAAAMRLAQGAATIDGVIVSRNEQIIFQNSLNLIYDSRVNSRYNNNPNQFINLGLPWGKPIQVSTFVELAPNGTGLSASSTSL